MTKATFVPVAFKNAFTDLEGLLPAVLAAPTPRREHYDRIAGLYRRLAVGSLLISADAADFFRFLFKSSRAYLYFAEHAAPVERVTSKAEAFFDAVACRDSEGARRLAAALPVVPARGREYEEDFFHARILMDLYAGKSAPAPAPAIQGMLTAWAALAQGHPDPRLDLCGALLARDQAGFDDAIAEAIAVKLKALAKRKEKDALPPDEGATTAHLSTEVLAWLEIAEAIGLKVAADYPLAPGVARGFDRLTPQPPNGWQAVL